MTPHYLITLSRQFGSGGGEIGKELAKELGINFVDKAIITNAAANSGIAKEHFERADEKHTNSFLYSLVLANYSGQVSPLKLDDIITDDKLFLHTSEAVKKAANEPCVILGRCADDILSDKKIVRIYIYADMEDRIKRISSLYELNEKATATLIKKTDKKRANYYNFYTSKTWGASENYDLCINSSKLSRSDIISVIMEFTKKFYQAN